MTRWSTLAAATSLILSVSFYARAQAPFPDTDPALPAIVVYDYTEQFIPGFPPLCDATSCPNPLVHTGPLPFAPNSFNDYIIRAKTTLHNFDSSAQNGTCQLFAFINGAPVILDETQARPDKGNRVEDGNAGGDKLSLSLQGALCPVSLLPEPIDDVGVVCSTFNGTFGETVLTLIPFPRFRPLNLQNVSPQGNASAASSCSPAMVQ